MSHSKDTFVEALSTCDFVLLDSDGVIYPITQKFRDHCEEAAVSMGQELFPGLSFDEATKIARKSLEEHGASIYLFAIGSEAKPEVVHDLYHRTLNTDLIPVNRALPSSFDAFPIPFAMLTHGHRTWARRVLDHLDLSPYFPDERIYPLEEVGFQKKSDSVAPFLHVLNKEGYQAERSIMVDDSGANLIYAKALGMTTVLIIGDKHVDPEQYPHVDFMVRDLAKFLSAVHGMRPSVPVEKQSVSLGRPRMLDVDF